MSCVCGHEKSCHGINQREGYDDCIECTCQGFQERKAMTDAEFMLEYVAKRKASWTVRTIGTHNEAFSREEVAKLDALEALAKMTCPKTITTSEYFLCHQYSHCEALRKFRTAMEKPHQAGG